MEDILTTTYYDDEEELNSNIITIKPGNFSYYNSIYVDPTKIQFKIEDPSNEFNSIIISKKIINEIPYFISKNRVFYSIYYDDDTSNQNLDDLQEIFGLMEEIGIYDKDTNQIIYKYDNVILKEVNNIKYIITENNKVFRYDNHNEIGIYMNNQIIVKHSDRFNEPLLKRNDFKSDISLYFNDSKIGKEYFYFAGQIYRKDNFTKGDLSLRYEN